MQIKSIYFLAVVICILLISMSGNAQVTLSQIAYYSFNNCDATDDTGNGSNGTLNGNIACGCGVEGSALQFDGVDDFVSIFGPVNTFFDTDNFSIAFFFKNTGSFNRASMISKRIACDPNNYIDIQSQSLFNNVVTELSQNSGLRHSFSNPGPQSCWQHYTLTRKDGIAKVYLNGILVETSTLSNTVDMNNTSELNLGGSPCIGINGTVFYEGLLDELRVYSRALEQAEVLENYTSMVPDNITSLTTLLYQGNSIDITISTTCATSFLWTPSLGVTDVTAAETTITPSDTSTYTLSFIDEFGCISKDSITINVLDPSAFNCNEVYLPNAFTPNGDMHNETFFISNAPVLQELIAFEIYDRWGERLFVTDDPTIGWDGNIKNTKANPGVYVYRLVYKCNNEEFTKSGEVSLIR